MSLQYLLALVLWQQLLHSLSGFLELIRCWCSLVNGGTALQRLNVVCSQRSSFTLSGSLRERRTRVFVCSLPRLSRPVTCGCSRPLGRASTVRLPCAALGERELDPSSSLKSASLCWPGIACCAFVFMPQASNNLNLLRLRSLFRGGRG